MRLSGRGRIWDRIENLPDDVEGHGYKWRMELEGDDVRAHLQHLQGAELTGTDDDGNTVKLVFDKVDGNDVEGHGARIGG